MDSRPSKRSKRQYAFALSVVAVIGALWLLLCTSNSSEETAKGKQQLQEIKHLTADNKELLASLSAPIEAMNSLNSQLKTVSGQLSHDQSVKVEEHRQQQYAREALTPGDGLGKPVPGAPLLQSQGATDGFTPWTTDKSLWDITFPTPVGRRMDILPDSDGAERSRWVKPVDAEGNPIAYQSTHARFGDEGNPHPDVGYPMCPFRPAKTKVHVHYHIQHHIGTALRDMAKKNDECAPRVCSQINGECLMSWNEKSEAAMLLRNNLTYVSYELPLPLQFPLPFVDKKLREKFLFTIVMRDPVKRLISGTGPHRYTPMVDTASHFILQSNIDLEAESLAARWLSGSEPRAIVREHDIEIAKCRLDLFDLVITDDLLADGLKLLCKIRDWEKCEILKQKKKKKKKPISEFDQAIIVGWIERQRLSYELYDYSRMLAAKQLKAAGIDVPPLQSSIDTALALALGKEPDPSVLPQSQQQSSSRFMRSIKPPRQSVCQELYKSWGGNLEEGIPFLRSFFTIDPRPKQAQPTGEDFRLRST